MSVWIKFVGNEVIHTNDIEYSHYESVESTESSKIGQSEVLY